MNNDERRIMSDRLEACYTDAQFGHYNLLIYQVSETCWEVRVWQRPLPPEMQDPPVSANSLLEANTQGHEMLLQKLRDRGKANPTVPPLDWERVPAQNRREHD
jgi:hypothetical protein